MTVKAVKPGVWARHGAKLVISLVLGAAFTWAMSHGGIPLWPPGDVHLAPWAIPGFCGVIALAHLARAGRFRHLLAPLGKVPLREVMAASWIAFAIILLAPLRSGEVARPLLVARKKRVGLWEATGAIGAERVVDALVLSTVLVLGLAFVRPQDPLPDHVGELSVPVSAVPGAALLAAFVFACAFVVMALFYWRRDLARRLVTGTLGLVSKRLADAIATIVERLATGLGFLPNRRLLLAFVGETLVYWCLLVLATWILLSGVGLPEADLARAAVVMGTTGLGILAPSGPGFFGVFQLSAYMALALFWAEDRLLTLGATFVFFYYVLQVAGHLVFALLGLVIDRDGK